GMRRWLTALPRTGVVRRVLVLAAAVACTMLPLAPAALAQQSDQDRARQLFQQLDATDSEQQAAKSRLADLQKQRQTLDQSLTSLGSQLQTASARVAAAQAEADRIGAIAVDLQAKVEETSRQLARAEDDVRRSALLLYTRNDGASTVAVLQTVDGSGRVVEA